VFRVNFWPPRSRQALPFDAISSLGKGSPNRSARGPKKVLDSMWF
jgi:hypothetical protein